MAHICYAHVPTGLIPIYEDTREQKNPECECTEHHSVVPNGGSELVIHCILLL